MDRIAGGLDCVCEKNIYIYNDMYVNYHKIQSPYRLFNM